MMVGEPEGEAPASEVDSSTNEATHTSITATTAGADAGDLELPEVVPPPPDPFFPGIYTSPRRTQVTQTNESLRPLRISDTGSQTDYFTRISSPEIHYGVEASSRNNRLYMSHSAQSRSIYTKSEEKHKLKTSSKLRTQIYFEGVNNKALKQLLRTPSSS